MKTFKKKLIGAAAAIVLSLTMCTATVFAGAVDTTATYSVDSNQWSQWPQGPDITSRAAVVMEAGTGTVVYAKGASEARYPTGLNKLMTALLTLQYCDVNASVTITDTGYNAALNGNANAETTVGEVFTIEQCLKMIVVKSANDIATQLAEYVSGSVDGFVQLMNNTAVQIGCENSYFTNPTGLDDENNYSCPHDMAIIMRQLMQYDTFRYMITQTSVTIPETNIHAAREYSSSVMEIIPDSGYYYPGCIGGKSASGDQDGNSLVCCFNIGGVEMIAVVMGAPDDATAAMDMASIADYAYGNFSCADVSGKYEQVYGGVVCIPATANPEDVVTNVLTGAESDQMVYYSYYGRTVGYGQLTEVGFELLRQDVSDSSNSEETEKQEQKQEDQPLVEEDTAEEDGTVSTATVKQDNKTMKYVIMGVLAALIILCLNLIIIGAVKLHKLKKGEGKEDTKPVEESKEEADEEKL